jgi:hypothetical protein
MKLPRPQFRLRSLFILTAIVAVLCLVGPPIVREVRARLWPDRSIKYITIKPTFELHDESTAPSQVSPPTE